MALHVGLRRQARAGGDHRLFRPADRARAASARRKARDARGAPPPILLIHGDQDPMIPVDAMFVAADELAAANIPVAMAHVDGRRPRHRRRRPAARRTVPGQGVRGSRAEAVRGARRARVRRLVNAPTCRPR